MKDNFIHLILLIIILVICEAIAMTSITYYSKNNEIKYMIAGCIGYGLFVPYFILQSLKFEGISTVNFMGNIFSTIIMVAIGYTLFNETLNYMKLLAFTTGLLSIGILYYAD